MAYELKIHNLDVAVTETAVMAPGGHGPLIEKEAHRLDLKIHGGVFCVRLFKHFLGERKLYVC